VELKGYGYVKNIQGDLMMQFVKNKNFGLFISPSTCMDKIFLHMMLTCTEIFQFLFSRQFLRDLKDSSSGQDDNYGHLW
jgi:hypothetical protein